MVIETARTRLRRFCGEDLANLIELESDPEVMRQTAGGSVRTAEQSAVRLDGILAREAWHAPLGVWALERKDDQTFLGLLMLIPTRFEFPEIGFMIARQHWGQGFATEAATGLIYTAFKDFGLKGLTATSAPENDHSLRVLTKLGFTPASSHSIAAQPNLASQPLTLLELRRP